MKNLLVLLSALFIVGVANAQSVKQLTIEKIRTMDVSKVKQIHMGTDDEFIMDHTEDVLLVFDQFDFPTHKIDSVQVIIDDKKKCFKELNTFVVSNISKETSISVMMFDKGDTLEFPASGSDVLVAKVDVHAEPLILEDSITFGILVIILALIFYTAHSKVKVFRKFYAVVPALLMCYLIPGILNSTGVISAEYSGLYGVAKTYFLPAALILMTIGIDFKGIIKLGPKALIMFFTATIGIILGGPFAIWVYSFISPDVVGGVGDEATWKGMSTLAGSWIGGNANQLAMLEYFEYKKSLFGKMIVVDVIVAQMWMIFLLWAAARHQIFDKWFKADVSAIEDLKARMEKYESENTRKPQLTDYIIILGLTFGLVSFAHWISGILGPYFESLWGENSTLASKFFWMVSICTIGAISYAATRARKYEGVGASKLGSVFIYILVCIIGMTMDFSEAFKEPQLILVGMIWMLFHAVVLFLVAKWIRAPFFFLAVGSKANVGGAASAPVVAAAFHPSLASVGVILAVLGYAIGTFGAMISGYLMMAVAP